MMQQEQRQQELTAEARRDEYRAKLAATEDGYRESLTSQGVELNTAIEAAFVLTYVPVGTRTVDQHHIINDALHQLIGPAPTVAVEGQSDG